MSKLKKFIALATVFCIFFVSVYAQTKDVSSKETGQNENVMAVSKGLISNVDNSIIKRWELFIGNLADSCLCFR